MEKIWYLKKIDIFEDLKDDQYKKIDDSSFMKEYPKHHIIYSQNYETKYIYYLNEEQKRIAEKSKIELSNSMRYDKWITVEYIKASKFYKAEEYHQEYYKKNPPRYKYYRDRCERDQYLE